MLGDSNKNYNLSLTSLSGFPLPVLFAGLNCFNRQWNISDFSTPLQFHFSTKKKILFYGHSSLNVWKATRKSRALQAKEGFWSEIYLFPSKKKNNLIALNNTIYPKAIVVEKLNDTFSNSLRKFRYISVWKLDEKKMKRSNIKHSTQCFITRVVIFVGAGDAFSLSFAYWLVAYKWQRLITINSVSASFEFHLFKTTYRQWIFLLSSVATRW